jgi:hypothetical protein
LASGSQEALYRSHSASDTPSVANTVFPPSATARPAFHRAHRARNQGSVGTSVFPLNISQAWDLGITRTQRDRLPIALVVGPSAPPPTPPLCRKSVTSRHSHVVGNGHLRRTDYRLFPALWIQPDNLQLRHLSISEAQVGKDHVFNPGDGGSWRHRVAIEAP